MCSLFVPLSRPKIAPLADESQYGAANPVNDGTT